MNFKIAFCTNASVFKNNKILDEDCAKKYPGSAWVKVLANLASIQGIELVTGDLALSYVQSKKWKASDVLVIQEESAEHAVELIGLGAIPLLIMCLESPVYASAFYAHLNENSKKFSNRILFRGAFKYAPSELNHVAFFPSFSSTAEIKNKPWDDRKFLVMVAGNKYWKIIRPMHRQIMSYVRDFIFQKKSYLTPDLINTQLHDKRLELIEFFGNKEDLDLFGPGWESLTNLPRQWRMRLKSFIERQKPRPCSDKHEVISHYKFSICFENLSYPGYVTEKIIDCLTVGVIPIYIGAPDISDFVPKKAFIDLNTFKDYKELDSFIHSLSKSKAEEIINSGKAFLESEKGCEFSYEFFANNVMNMILKYIQ